MTVTIFGGDLSTGLIRVRNIPAAAGNCNETLGAAGSIGATIPLPMKVPDSDRVVAIRSLLLPAQSYLAWDEDGVIRNAGPIWTDSYSFDKQRLTLNAAGLRSYFQYRYVIPLLIDADKKSLPSGKQTRYTGLSLGTIAKRLVQQAQGWTNGSVPLVFEDDVLGDNERTYRASDLHVLDEKLQQLSEVLGGPDIMFKPRYANPERTHIEWVMTTGKPEISQAPGADHKWDMTGIPHPDIKGASITRDATVLTTDNYQTGSVPEDEGSPGVDAEPLMAKAVRPNIDPLVLRMESSEDRSSVINLPVLQQYADQAVLTGDRVLETWSFEVRKSGATKISAVSAGDYARVATKDDPGVGTAENRLRLLEINTTLATDWAKVSAQPRRVTT